MVVTLDVLVYGEPLIEGNGEFFSRWIVNVRRGQGVVNVVGELVLVGHEVVRCDFHFLGVFCRGRFLEQFFSLFLGAASFAAEKFAKTFFVWGDIAVHENGRACDHVIHRCKGRNGAFWEAVERKGGHGLHLVVLIEDEAGRGGGIGGRRQGVFECRLQGVAVGLCEDGDGGVGGEGGSEGDFFCRHGAKAEADVTNRDS